MINPSTSPLICSVRYSFTELINLNVYFCDFSTWTRPHNVPSLAIHANTVWVKKNPPLKFSDIFPKLFGIFSPNFTRLLSVRIYARTQFFIQLSPTVTTLCRTKCDHPACVSVDDGHFEHIMVDWWSHLIWRNFVKAAGNQIKICSPA